MALYALFLLVGVSCLLTLWNWRLGLFLCVLVGLLQDPVRKMTTGQPSYVLLLFMPIYLCMMLRMWSENDLTGAVRRYFPQLIGPGLLFGLCLLCSAMLTVNAGPGGWMLALLGVFSYAGAIPAIGIGFYYFRKDFANLDRMLAVFVLLITVMLLGVPLEYYEVKLPVNVLGMVNYTRGNYLRWYDDFHYVRMISGFHRSPEVMGWQAALLVILSIYLSLRRPLLLPLWLTLAGWGIVCVLLSGRRKMLLLVLLFVLVLTLLTRGWYRQRLLVILVIACVVMIPVLGYFVSEAYLNTAESTVTTFQKRMDIHLQRGPAYLMTVVGPFGYGVGTRSQGAHLLTFEVPVPDVEGGLEKCLVELGLIGTAALVLLGAALGRVVWQCYRRAPLPATDKMVLGALMAFIVANLGAFTVAYQIFGDPLVLVLIGFAVGALLSGRRLAAQHLAAARRGAAPPAAAPPGPFPRLAPGAWRDVG